MSAPAPTTSVAYFGPAGTFTEMALDRILGEVLPGRTHPVIAADVSRVVAASPVAVIELVRTGTVDAGCVPLESSVEGSVPATMDALAAGGSVQILAETVLDIAFTVAARPGVLAADVATIAAYPVAEGQTRDSVARLYPDASIVPATSNAAAAADVAAGRADAALTTALAASAHGLVALAEGVADAADATTRFVLIGRPTALPAPTGSDRTSVILDLPDEPGSLVRALSEFATRDIDLTRIESRPKRRTSGYHFFLDASGHLGDPVVAEAVAALHAYATSVTFLGSWPADRTNGSPPPDRRGSLEWVEALRRGER